MDIQKLNEELEKSSVERADEELNRMIKLHEDEAKVAKENIKRYLQGIATNPAKRADYQAANADMTLWAGASYRAELLKQLKKELE